MALTITQCIKYKFTTMAKNQFRAAKYARTIETADSDGSTNDSPQSFEEYEDRR